MDEDEELEQITVSEIEGIKKREDSKEEAKV